MGRIRWKNRKPAMVHPPVLPVRKEAGFTYIEFCIVLSALIVFLPALFFVSSTTEKEIKEMIHIAHEEGFSAMAHANGARTVEAAAAAGVDSIDHGADLDQDALQAMEDNGTVWVPTLSTIGNLRGKGRFNKEAVCRILDSALYNVSQYKGLLAAGTDAGAWAVPHGSLTEYELLHEVLGTGAEEVLDAGTRAIMDKF